MINDFRVDLRVPYAEKDQAKVHGAPWDAENRTWYATPGTNLENLKRRLPRGVIPESSEPDPPPAKAAEKGIALTELLGRVKGVINEGFPTAVWVRAEISKLRGKNGQLYLNLTERNDWGDIRRRWAHVSAPIPRSLGRTCWTGTERTSRSHSTPCSLTNTRTR